MIYYPVTPTKAEYAAWHTIRQDEIGAEAAAPKARVEATPPKAAPATPVYFTRRWHKTDNGGNEAARLRTPKGEYFLCVFNSKYNAGWWSASIRGPNGSCIYATEAWDQRLTYEEAVDGWTISCKKRSADMPHNGINSMKEIFNARR